MSDEGFEHRTEPAGPDEEQHTPPIPMPGIAGTTTPPPPPPIAGTTMPPPPPGYQQPQSPGYQPPPSAPLPPPIQPLHSPAGPPSGSPSGSYALGALAGNPQLGSPAGSGYGGPPTAPGAPGWAGPPPPGATPPQRHHLRNGVAITAAALVALAAGVGIGHSAWQNSPVTKTASPPTTPTGSGSNGSSGSSGSPFNGFGSGSGSNSSGSTPSGGSGPSDVSSIAAKVDPGLVDIDTSLGYADEQAAGTGIVLTSDGEILTNNHVIDGATTISVTDVGNGKTYTASVVGYDRTQDIAVLQLNNASGLQTATIGNSSNVAVGEDVVGIGNAGGTGGTPSAAGGTVTALNQSITASDEGDDSTEQLTNLIETNADIQAGDSGGALVNTSGTVLGIDTAASAGFSFQSPQESSGNQGYAIPINEATSIAKQIEAKTASSTVHIGATGFLGVEVAQGSCDSTGDSGGSGFGGGGFGGFGGTNSGGTNSGGSTPAGALVCSVITSSPAQEGGLAEGDTITSVNDQTVTSPTTLTKLLEPYHPGDKVTIGWVDASGESHTTSVTLTSGPPQ